MSSERFILAALLMVSVFIPSILHVQASAHLTPTAAAFRLPIAPGLKVYINQGNNDTEHDHFGKAAWAFDFIVGQTNFVVTAAQGGMVMGADDSSSVQCGGLNTEIAPENKYLQDCWTYANYVLIADDDGTTASLYLHLLPHSLKVSSGMHINQGASLGLAGTTGWSTGVHLHFQVENIPQQSQSAGWWWTQSRPVQFSNQEVLAQESNGVPKEGESFTVSNPPVLIPPSLPTPPNPAPVPTPIHTPAPTAIPGIEPFVGTWWTAQGAVTLTINADGSATYQSQSNGVKAQIQFTSVQGIRAYGTVVSGTTIPAWGPDPSPQNDIPVGGYIYIILVDAHTLLVSNGQTLCPNTEQCAS